MTVYILTGSTPQAITLRPVLAPSTMGGVTVPWANIASVTTHMGSVVVHTNNRRVTYKINRGASEEQRRLVEETFGLTHTAERDEQVARMGAQLAELKAAKAQAKAERKAAKAEAKRAKREAKAA